MFIEISLINSVFESNARSSISLSPPSHRLRIKRRSPRSCPLQNYRCTCCHSSKTGSLPLFPEVCYLAVVNISCRVLKLSLPNDVLAIPDACSFFPIRTFQGAFARELFPFELTPILVAVFKIEVPSFHFSIYKSL